MESTNTAHSHLRVCTNSSEELVVPFIELVLACLCVCVCVRVGVCVCVYVCVGVCVLTEWAAQAGLHIPTDSNSFS